MVCYILKDYLQILDDVKFILIENDYGDKEHEIKMRESLVNNKFKLVYYKHIIDVYWGEFNFL